MNWHTLNTEEVFSLLESSRNGLRDFIAEERLMESGPNKLQELKRKTPLQIFMLQFKNIMILILIFAAIVSGLIGQLKDTVVISAIVILNAVIGFIQEYRAEKAMEALKKITAAYSNVIRNGILNRINSEQIVCGDIVVLEAGDIIPADLRIIESFNLKTDEASLTGESIPVLKNTHKIPDHEVSLSERANMLFKGTVVTYGRGSGIVVATGMNTEIGKIAMLIQEKESISPLQSRMNDFVKKLSIVILLISFIIFLAGLIRGDSPVQMLLISISLAVAAIPEALPAVIVISLSLGAKRMLKKNALIRKLQAVESLGSVTVICSDKTGTLTENKMSVVDHYVNDNLSIQDENPEKLLMLSMLLNQNIEARDEDGLTGDPTEAAIVNYVQKKLYNWKELLSENPKIFELPFDSDRKMMTTVHKWKNKFLIITKGAVESVIKKCTVENKDEILRKADQSAEKGLRIIAYGVKVHDKDPSEQSPSQIESDLNFLGYCGMIDPPREEVKEAVQKCHSAGIIPVMITGDHPLTAKAIAANIGILDSPHSIILTGKELKELNEVEYIEKVERIRVYARVTPEQKLGIVKTLQEKGNFVAMTGDGVNDAPAIKRANVGISMGITGTDVSKEVSQIVLLDDNFATIMKAVVEGRKIYDNIRKFIRYILTGNSAELITILFAPLIGLPFPLIPIQILWVNLITDGLPGLAFSSEKEELNILEKPPRNPNESIFSHGLGFHVIWVGIFISVLCLSLQSWAVMNDNENWQTIVFTALCFSQLGHAFAVRSETHFVYRQGVFSNTPFLFAIISTIILQLLVLYVPFLANIFEVHPLTALELSLTILSGIIVFHVVEAEKYFRKKFIKKY